jgi:hypothetical protein
LSSFVRDFLKGDRYRRVTESNLPRAKALIANYNAWKHRKDHPENSSSVLYDTAAVYLIVDDKLVEMETIKLARTTRVLRAVTRTKADRSAALCDGKIGKRSRNISSVA